MDKSMDIKKAFKGFDKNLKCKDFQFKIGEIAKVDNDKPLKLCSDSGLHYSNELKDVFTYYPNNNSNRFCEVEIIGEYLDSNSNSKSICKTLKPIRELTKEDLLNYEKELQEIKIEKNLNLDIVQKLQNQYSTLFVGGSIALFLHGVRLKRWQNCSGDIDMINPYFILITNSENNFKNVTCFNDTTSGNDFDKGFMIDNVKCDLKIEPYQPYTIINYKGFDYKVALLEQIIEAKSRYALNGQNKHKEDLKEMLIR